MPPIFVGASVKSIPFPTIYIIHNIQTFYKFYYEESKFFLDFGIFFRGFRYKVWALYQGYRGLSIGVWGQGLRSPSIIGHNSPFLSTFLHYNPINHYMSVRFIFHYMSPEIGLIIRRICFKGGIQTFVEVLYPDIHISQLCVYSMYSSI
jgi:hypothetical protein